MNGQVTEKKQQERRKGTGGRRLGVLATVLSCVLMVGPSNATGIPVVDAASILKQVIVSIERGLEHVETISKWTQQLNHMRQQVVQIQSMLSSIGMPANQPLTKVGDNYLVAESCGGSGGFSLASLASVFRLNTSGDVMEQQKQICVNIRVARNKKFDYTVDFVQRTAPQMQTMLDRLNSQRNSNNNQGNLQAVDSDSMRMANDLALKFQVWEGQMKAYDTYIASMEENQRVLARTALKGKQTIVGAIVETAVLKTALSVGN